VSTKITQADIIDALREAMRPTEVNVEGAWTFRQIADILNVPDCQVRRGLQHLRDAGKLEAVRIPYTRIDGTAHSKPAYRIKL